MNDKLKVGIIGCGFIGTALKNWLEENNTNVETRVSDPPKGMNDDISDCDAYFIQIHIPTEEDGTQDLTLLKSIVNNLPCGRPIWIRTTILPGTAEMLTNETGRLVYHMPEFLTERTYLEDFKWQPMVFTGDVELLKKIFPGKKHIDMSSAEAELVKYAHNCFGCVKVIYFNAIYELCQKLKLNYDVVRQGILGSTYINEPHTLVPGPDGKMGFGGKCFTKDIKAFEHAYHNTSIGKILNIIQSLNNTTFRNQKLK